VFNRWGNKLFNTVNYNNVDNKWDGKVNGQAVSAGTYFYILVDDTEKLLKKGWIEITN
jgi:gliding motility-associated-like protein